jgi:hypothetical protein
MKKIIIPVLFFVSVLTLYGQNSDYVAFPTDNAKWVTVFENYYTTPTRIYSVSEIRENDTIINGINYSMIYTDKDTGSTWCAFREENKRIYFLFPDKNNEEILMYDFNLEVGDTMFYYFEDIFETTQHHKVVTAIDTIRLVNGEIRHKWTLSPFSPWGENYSAIRDIWVDGIGSIDWQGLFNPLVTFKYTNGDDYHLGLFCHNDTTLFYNPSCPYFDIFGCYLAISIENFEAISDNISIYPNPTQNQVTIDFGEQKIKEIEMINLVGKVLKQIEIHDYNHSIVDISDISAGIYLLKFTTAESVITKKIIKQ